MTATIASHFCGQTQPHAAHTWKTPPTYGTATLIFDYQCAGHLATIIPVRGAETEESALIEWLRSRLRKPKVSPHLIDPRWRDDLPRTRDHRADHESGQA